MITDDLQVVVVDDNPIDLEDIERGLARLGAHCVLLTSAEACLQYLEGLADLPNLLIADIRMPDVNGFDLLQAVTLKHPNLPIALVTGMDGSGISMQALRLGAFDLLSKPIDAAQLRALCERVADYEQDSATAMDVSAPVLERSLTIRARTSRDLPTRLSRSLCREVAQWHTRSAVDFLKLRTALIEALENAITHGNLEAPSSIKALDPAAFEAELDRRMQEARYADREISVEMTLDTLCLRIAITNEGPGFDPTTVIPAEEPSLLSVSGRGLFLINSAFDRVSWRNAGRTIEMALMAGAA